MFYPDGMAGRLEGKVAVVTGGGNGIGRATVLRFLQEGASVLVADLNTDTGAETVALAEQAGHRGRTQFLRTDVAEEAQVQVAIERAQAAWGRLDCVFNNAGLAGAIGPITHIEVEHWDFTMRVLLRSVFLGMKHAAPIMKRQGSGSIISTASVAGLRTGLGPHVYSAAKAAVIHLTHSVAMELGENGIRVNCICPGGIATPIFGKAFGVDADRADATIPLIKGVLETMQPIRRSGLPEDIAQAALWLACDDSTFANGHALVSSTAG